MSRLFCEETLRQQLPSLFHVKQVNHTLISKAGTIKGFHYQRAPHAESKLVTCVVGSVLDVMIDLRKGSRTFLNYCSLELSQSRNNSVVIPEGCAHGLQTLSDGVNMIYFHSEFYTRSSEGGVHPFDPRINFKWPLSVTELSKRDMSFEHLDSTFKGIEV